MMSAKMQFTSGSGRALNQVKPNHSSIFCFFFFYYCLFSQEWSCPQPSQAEPLHQFIFYFIFYYCLFLLHILVDMTNHFFDHKVMLFYFVLTRRWIF